MKILIKYPSRGRPKAFFEGLDSIVWNLHDADKVAVWVTYDADDPEWKTMNAGLKEYYSRLTIYECLGESDNKIHAINRDLSTLFEWDLLIIMSDDMRFTSLYFDKIIRDQFADGDFDKLLHFPDQDAKHALATMYIAGKTFYERFGYVYHPSYRSLWCDNEIMEVAQKLGKYHYVDYPGVVSHLNPAYGYGEKDEMFIEQQRVGWDEDHKNYMRRKSEWEELEGEELIKYMQKI